ncbi:MAG: hypothetical protein WAV04_00660 [Candidatus Microsaccharimonas sp.]
MRLKQTVKLFFVGLLLVVGLIGFVAPSTSAAECGGVTTSIISCDQTGEGGGVENTGAWGILLLAINILTAGIGVVALGGIVYASIMYISAGGSPEQVKKAMGIIMNIVIGIIAYAGMYALLNFLVPGGLFN